MYAWTFLTQLATKYDFEEYRDKIMCCSVIEHKEDKDMCAVCGVDHVSIERRIQCTSVTCSNEQKCSVVWKVHHCTATDASIVYVNEAAHERGTLDYDETHRPRVTPELKLWLAAEDDAMILPSMIETRLRNGFSKLRKPSRGAVARPDYQRDKANPRENGLRNTVEGIKAFVVPRAWQVGSEHEPEKAVVLSSKRDSSGFPYVAYGTTDDPFMLGVTSPSLIDNVLRFVDGKRFTIFHADATFKLSEYIQ